MKLIDILFEVLRESKPITLDKDVFPQMEKVYANFLEESKDERVVAYIEGGGEATLGRIKFKNPYDPSFDGVIVRLVFNEDRNTRGWYNRSTRDVYINVNSKVGSSKSIFINTLYHELVHAIDPKLNNKKVTDNLYSKLNTKNAKDTSDDHIKYLKNPAEFDAWSSTFINRIKNNLEDLEDMHRQKAKVALRGVLNYLLLGLNNKPLDNSDADIDQELETIKTLLFGSSGEDMSEFLYNMIHYLNEKPSLFKKYIKRLSTLL
jgi:hypothetical protein